MCSSTSDDSTAGVWLSASAFARATPLGIGVRRGYRRRGFGRILTQWAIQDGAEAGACTAVLQATSAGYPLHLGMGFRMMADYHLWDIPAVTGGGHAE
jgi:hypothetical protein